MKVYDTRDIRNVVLIGHGDSGKTSLTSALLFVGGAVKRLGRTEDGTAVTDFDEEEVHRKISLQTAIAHLEWKGHKVNLLDTPGYAAFVADAKSGVAVADGAVLLVEGVAGVQVITRAHVPLRRGVRAAADLRRQQARPGARVLRARVGSPDPGTLRARGAADPAADRRGARLRRRRRSAGDEGHALRRRRAGSPPRSRSRPTSAEAARAAARATLVEMVAETDDKLMEAFFDTGDLTQEQLRRRPARAPCSQRKMFPVMCAAATQPRRRAGLLDALIVDSLPAPGERGPAAGTRPDGRRGGAPRRRCGRAPVAVRVQDDRRSVRRAAVAVPRHARARCEATRRWSTPAPGIPERLGNRRADPGQADRNRSPSCAPATSASWPSSRTRTPATRWPTPATASRYRADRLPRAVDLLRRRAQVQGRRGEDLRRAGPADRGGSGARAWGATRRPHELLVAGTSQVHVEVAIQKMKKKFGVEALAQAAQGARTSRRSRRRSGRSRASTRSRPAAAASSRVCVIEMEPRRARRRLRVRGQDLRRLDPAELPAGRGQGDPGGARRAA